MKRHRVTPSARADLFEIWEYIARDDVNAADRVIAEIEAALPRLARMPGLGHSRPDLADPRYRIWVVRSFLVVYRRTGRSVVVVRVVHGARNLRGLSSEEE